MKKFKDARLDALVRSLPYARVGAPSGARVTLLDRRGQEGQPTVGLDGRRSDIGIVMELQVRDLLSLEVMRMRGDVPVEYQEFSDCGAILVWLRPASMGR